MSVRILIGDMRVRLKELPDNSVDSVVCDPPYHLTNSNRTRPPPHLEGSPYSRHRMGVNGDTKAQRGFMGQEWDGGDVAFQPDTWAEVLRVLKPGGHLVAFSGTRTYHRMAVAIEDAGFEVRDMLSWLYGSGFPKSLDVSKAIDKAAGAEREVVGTVKHRDIRNGHGRGHGEGIQKAQRGDGPVQYLDHAITAPATEAAREWQGWGTALKPAHEPICLARKPLSEKSVAANVLKWGTGALNVDACRIEGVPRTTHADGNRVTCEATSGHMRGKMPHGPTPAPEGRWPANVCHDGSDEVVAGFPAEAGGGFGVRGQRTVGEGWAARNGDKNSWRGTGETVGFGDSGSAARFFYCAKATTEERGEGNNHPTVKPISLMEWLVKLVTPKGGTVLDPFMGSGSTALACDRLQFDFIGCELSPEYAAIAEARIRAAAGMFADVRIAA